jgi:GTP-binding protein
VDVKFVTSAPNLAGRPELILPEFAFIGRSNCGKSSLINNYFRRTSMAKTSGKPGKTRLLNYFLVQDRYYVVDLPGYGFAKVSKSLRAQWWKLFHQFITAQDRPLAVFQLLDVRHRPTAEDLEVSQWIQDAGLPYALAITKIDKVGTNSRMARYQEIIQTLNVSADTPFFPTSSAKGTGRDDMRLWVNDLLDQSEEEE